MHRLLLILMTFVGGASGLSCSAKNAPILNERSTVMKVEFKRTGGFSPITNASGTIEFKDDGAHVSSPQGNYQRSLTPEESTNLRSAASPQNFAGQDAAASNDQIRDGFNYQITITTNDGKQHTFNTSELQKVPAAGSEFIKWVQQESQRILSHRSGSH
jgi:emfourin